MPLYFSYFYLLLLLYTNRAAVQECPSEESDPDDHLRAEQRQKNLEAKHANIRELIGKYLNRLPFIRIPSIGSLPNANRCKRPHLRLILYAYDGLSFISLQNSSRCFAYIFSSFVIFLLHSRFVCEHTNSKHTNLLTH